MWMGRLLGTEWEAGRYVTRRPLFSKNRTTFFEKIEMPRNGSFGILFIPFQSGALGTYFSDPRPPQGSATGPGESTTFQV